jgi:hypothetical protein
MLGLRTLANVVAYAAANVGANEVALVMTS